MRALGALPA